MRWLQGNMRLGESKEEFLVTINIRCVLLSCPPFLLTLLPADHSLCFFLSCWDASHHVTFSFNAVFGVAPLFPSNLFIMCRELGNQIRKPKS